MGFGKEKIIFFLKDFCSLVKFAIRFCLYGRRKKLLQQLHNNQKEIFILGNGPSLKKDLEGMWNTLKDKDVIIVNYAITQHEIFMIKPKFYCLADPAYWTDQKKQEYVQKSIQEICLALSRVDWKLTILAPHHLIKNQKITKNYTRNSKIKILGFNAIELYTFKKVEKFLYSHGYAVPSTINVLIVSLCCAITMKYEKIYLLGADSDWHKQLYVDQTNNQLYSNEKHFYGSTHQRMPMPYSLSFVFSCITSAFRAYEELAKLDFPIVNLSSNSMIDAFPRDTLENIFKEEFDK